jgi:RNA polymerase sigma-54 factor
MKQALQFRLSQHLALTPQLQQSIRLLQLSTLELNQEIEQVLLENPLLERIDDPMDRSVRLNADGTVKSDTYDDFSEANSNASAETRENGEPAEAAGDDSGRDDAHSDAESGADWGTGQGSSRDSGGGDDDLGLPQLSAAKVTLREHLLSQLALKHLGMRDYALVTILIEAVNEDGYLDQDLDEILAFLPAEIEVDFDEIATALKLLHSFDPPGVGARNAGECLALQLRPEMGGVSSRKDPAIVELARAIVLEHLSLLAARDYVRLKRLLHCEEDALREAQSLIRTLTPFPGRAFACDESHYAIPDVIVRKVRNSWRVTLNPDVMPKLRINQIYARVVREHRGSEHISSMSSRLQEARWLIKNVQQRFDTILRVSEAIVERQKNFFSHGEVAMRPLVLREIADTLGLHESTISRVTTQKFMLTPFGTFELKFFFGSHVATEAGGAASSTAIRALIKQLIAAEDPAKPFSDSKIAELLGEQGIVVARRTIAKYREHLRIPPVSMRKSF